MHVTTQPHTNVIFLHPMGDQLRAVPGGQDSLLCGDCGIILARTVSIREFPHVVIECFNCRAYNEPHVNLSDLLETVEGYLQSGFTGMQEKDR